MALLINNTTGTGLNTTLGSLFPSNGTLLGETPVYQESPYVVTQGSTLTGITFVDTIYNDTKGAVSGVAHAIENTINKVLDKGADLSNNVVTSTKQVITGGQNTVKDTLLGTSQNLSMPLVIGGVVVLLILLKR